METRRWNIEEYGNGIRICRGLHDKSVNCEWEYYVPPNDQLIEKLAEKVTNHYCKDELLKEMAEAFEEIVRCLSHGLQDCRASVTAKKMLQKYHEQIGEPK